MMRVLSVLCLLASPAGAESLKISTWNLNWLTTRTHAEANLPADVHTRASADFDRLAAYAAKLNADIIAFQEVDGPAAAARIFDPARYTILTIDEAVTQRVGLAIRHGIPVRLNPEYIALDVEPAARFPLRDGLDATLTLPGGHDLRILVVHLKTGCQTDNLVQSRRPQCTLLAKQIPPLADWAAARQHEGAAFLIMGDFNRVLDDPEELGTALAHAAPLKRVTEGRANPCWDGAPFIDHIFVGGAARLWLVAGSLRVQVFHSADERDKARLSDHCPVSVRLNTGR